jgi:hypothetical protein
VVHQGFGPTGLMSQPRSSLVGWGGGKTRFGGGSASGVPTGLGFTILIGPHCGLGLWVK